VEDIDPEDINDVPEEESLLDTESLAARFAESLELSDITEKQAAIEAFVELLGADSISLLEDSLNVVI
jgi:hypothetical protein